MRSKSWARWATCALAITVVVPVALADRTKKSIASCTAFDQVDKDDDAVQFTIHSTCSIPVDCSISWRLVCAPESKKRRAVHPGNVKLAFSDAEAKSVVATAAACGDDGWTIDQIRWSCQPNKD